MSRTGDVFEVRQPEAVGDGVFLGADLQGDGLTLLHRRVLGTVVPQPPTAGGRSQPEQTAAPDRLTRDRTRRVGDERQLCGRQPEGGGAWGVS